MGNQFYKSRLSLLKNRGFNPKVIYDIGAHQGCWSCETSEVFPESLFYLFEANEDNRMALQCQPFPFFIELLGNGEEEVAFYCRETPCMGESIFCEQSPYFQGEALKERRVKMSTLDSIVKKHRLPAPDLIKIDVQGAELMILQGSSALIGQAEAIILETKILEYNLGAPLGHELIAFMSTLGYRMLDIVECHYLKTGDLNEVDYLFVKQGSSLIPRPPFER